jgi:hypothetical protein
MCPQEDLARARQSFVMTTELHLTYLCVPVNEALAFLDWKKFEVMLGTLSVSATLKLTLKRTAGTCEGQGPCESHDMHAFVTMCMPW